MSAVEFYDTFTDGGASLDAHTPDTDTSSNGWTEVAGQMEVGPVNTDSVWHPVGVDPGGMGWLSTFDTGDADMFFDFAVWHDTANAGRGGVAFRVTDDDNCFRVDIDDVNNEVKVFNRVSGSDGTALATYNSTGGFLVDTYYLFRVLVSGLTCRVWGQEADGANPPVWVEMINITLPTDRQTVTDHGLHADNVDFHVNDFIAISGAKFFIRQIVSFEGDPANFNFDATPIEGSLLGVVASERSGGGATNFVVTNGTTDYDQRLATDNNLSDPNSRFSTVVETRVAGASEPTTVEVDDASSNTKRGTAFEIVYLEDAEPTWTYETGSGNGGGTSTSSPVTSGTTGTSQSGDKVVISVGTWRKASATIEVTSYSVADFNTGSVSQGGNNTQAHAVAIGTKISTSTEAESIAYTGANAEWIGSCIIVHAEAGAIVVTPGIAAETDSALAAGVGKTVTLGIATETDAALPLVAGQEIAVGIAVETDSALSASVSKTVQPGIASETDSAPAATASKTVQLGIATETDIGLTATVVKTVKVGFASETDSTFGVTKFVKTGVGLETDAALAATFSKTIQLGVAIETDTAVPANVSKTVQAGIAVEIDVVLAAGTGKTIQLGIASESDTALGLTDSLQVGVASETDTALAATVSKTTQLGLGVENDTALTATVSKTVGLGIATETDTTQTATPAKIVTLGVAVEVDSALPASVNGDLVIGVGIASESDVAPAATVLKTIGVGQAIETDSALPAATGKVVQTGIAVESDSALATTPAKQITLGVATEIDQALGFGQVVQPGIATESDVVLGLTALKTVSVGFGLETDNALALDAIIKEHQLGVAEETDAALPLSSGEVRVTIGNRFIGDNQFNSPIA